MTRIHPDDYDYARKMAQNSLELDEDDVEGEHPSRSVLRIMLDEDQEKKLHDLNLDDFAANLRDNRHVDKRLALETMKDEMIAPGKDRRLDFQSPDFWQILNNLTGETEETLKPGTILAGFVTRVTENVATIRLYSGMVGEVPIQLGSDSGQASLREIVSEKSTVRCLVHDKLQPGPTFKLVLSLRQIDLAAAEAVFGVVEPDRYFDHTQIQLDFLAAEQAKARTTERQRRQIDHPAFFNFNAGQAEEYLAGQPRGDVVIRPSSRGTDHLAITWKVDEGLYQHICSCSLLPSLFLSLNSSPTSPTFPPVASASLLPLTSAVVPRHPRPQTSRKSTSQARRR